METKWRVVALTTLAPISWGATYYLTRTYLPAEAPLWGATLRALPAGLILLLISRHLPRGQWWWKSAALGVLNVSGFFTLIYLSATLLPSSLASTIMALAPVSLALAGWAILGRKPGVAMIQGALLGIIGAWLLIGFAGGEISLIGVIASTSALISNSIGAILSVKWRGDTPLVDVTCWQLVAGGLILLPVALITEGSPPQFDGSALLALAFITVVATALATVCWLHGLSHLAPTEVGTIGLLNPLTGIGTGITFAGESLGPTQFIGITLILAGILLTTRQPRQRTSLATSG